MSDEFREKLAYWREHGLNVGHVPGGNRPRRHTPRPIQQPGPLEAGTVYEQRPGGERVPLIHADTLEPITRKQMANRRGHYNAQLEQLDAARHST